MCEVVEAWGVGPVRIIECGQLCQDFHTVQALKAMQRLMVTKPPRARLVEEGARLEPEVLEVKKEWYWEEAGVWRTVAPPYPNAPVREIQPLHAQPCDCDACGSRAALNQYLQRVANPARSDDPLKRTVERVTIPEPPAPDPRPTLQEIAEREREIARHHARVRRSKRVRVSILCALFLAALVCAGIFEPLLPMALLFTAVYFVSCKPPYADKVIRPLELKPYTAEENKYFMIRQGSEPFRATCACPSCGDVAVHSMREPKGAPHWASVVRTCGTCNREWAQA